MKRGGGSRYSKWMLEAHGLIPQNLHLTKEPSVVSCMLGSKVPFVPC